MLVAEGANDLGVMADGGGVDHAEAQAAARAPRLSRFGPVGEVAGEAEDLAGMADGGFGAGADPSAAPVALEQWHAEAPFEFGQALRQRRRTHADPLGGDRPRWRVGDGDEVLELSDREIGERAHPAEDTSDLLHNQIVK